MPKLSVGELRDRLPAVLVTVLIHVAVIAALLNAIQKYTILEARESETAVVLIPQKHAPLRAIHRATAGSMAISPDYYHYNSPPTVGQTNLDGLRFALSSCAPENLGNIPPEFREQCDRIDSALYAGQDTLPNAPHFKHEGRWKTELLLKQTPQLLPCASPHPPSPGMGIVAIDLGTLICIADLIRNGYRPETASHYSK